MSVNSCQTQSVFNFACLPADVIFLVAEYLSPEEKGKLSRVNKLLRELLNSPQPWKDTTFYITTTNISKCRHILNVLNLRKTRSIKFEKANDSVLKLFLRGLPDLHSLSLPNASPVSVSYIHDFGTNLRKLYLGEVPGSRYKVKREKLLPVSIKDETSRWSVMFKELKNLEDLSLGSVKLHSYSNFFADELKSSLSCHGNLRKLVINGCDIMPLTWIGEVFKNNPNLQSVGLCYIRHLRFDVQVFSLQGGLTYLRETCCPSLKTLDLSGSLRSNRFVTWTLEWFDRLSSLTSLNLSQTMDHRILRQVMQNLHKLRNLKRLDLTFSAIKDDMFQSSHPQLTWLELRGCFALTGMGIQLLSCAMGSSLQYLGLCNCSQLTDNDLKDLPVKFPSLNTLDLSGCSCITNVLLEELYLKIDDGHVFPALTQLVLKGCRNVTESAVNAVRLKTANKLGVDRTIDKDDILLQLAS